ncbi:hypothetical protein AB870_22615 [Pandoraea faecigallinarum]|uniref:Glycine zipper domain-containing protein n=1 Tax=Pandoraea faecigallinarum TaxID=656179 RepID=A0A0H3WVR3_9BURK|nr:hypothetical protein [Pandoraea faecigallinarum]AKM32294.1 hypothetical protein AB870_22615 [Pandoraea faecigallinarum]
MATIVAGRFDTFDQAGEVARRLYARRFRTDDVSIFFLNPAGQHARFPIGGDMHADPGARPGGLGAVLGLVSGLIAGAAIGATIYRFGVPWWPIPIIAALVGGYGGALAGALSRMRSRRARAQSYDARDAGVIVATHVTAQTADSAMTVLRNAGADDIQRTEGVWEDGEWRDFSPLSPAQPPTTKESDL